MEKLAVTKYVRVSAFKAREVARLIQGRPVDEALSMLDLMPRKAARLVAKTVRSAQANALDDNRYTVNEEDLFVKEAVVGEGPTMRRWQPKARGSAGRIRKRMSHIRVVLTDEQP